MSTGYLMMSSVEFYSSESSNSLKILLLFFMYYRIGGCKLEAFKKFTIESDSVCFCLSSSNINSSLIWFLYRKTSASSMACLPNIV